MEILELRDKIIEKLGTELGVYTFSNNQKIPAVTIASNRLYPPPGTLIEGLEAIIYPYIGSSRKNFLGSILIEKETRLILNQWDTTKDTIVAHDLLLLNFADILQRIGPRLLADGNRQTIESQVFYLATTNLVRWRQ